MKTRIKTWKSPSLGREMKLMIAGKEGTPVIVFPSAFGDYFEWNDHHALDMLGEQIDSGYNQFFCLDSFAEDCFLNDKVPPVKRMIRFNHYQDYVMDEVLPFISEENSNPYLITTGVALGAYAALLMALKFPTQFNKVISLSGYFDISEHMGGVVDDYIYFNNPVEFIPNLNDEKLLGLINSVDIRLLNYKNDPTREKTRKMSDILWLKFIEHEHYVWDEEAENMWDIAPNMLKDNLF
jgi:esterase/lipase superfamily enzyme